MNVICDPQSWLRDTPKWQFSRENDDKPWRVLFANKPKLVSSQQEISPLGLTDTYLAIFLWTSTLQ